MAQRDADKARADGRAYEIKVQGEAQADAIRIMGEALAKNPLVVEYKKMERWGGQFPTTFMGGDAAARTLWTLPGAAPHSAAAAASPVPGARPATAAQ
jgi:regulator of protease activity HflC (stomatin/prohibitin superfamily)